MARIDFPLDDLLAVVVCRPNVSAGIKVGFHVFNVELLLCY